MTESLTDPDLRGRYFVPDPVVDLSPYVGPLAGTQMVLGFVLLFLLGLGLRNRFRLK